MIIRDFFLIREKMMVLAKCRTGTAEKAMVQKFFAHSFQDYFSIFSCATRSFPFVSSLVPLCTRLFPV